MYSALKAGGYLGKTTQEIESVSTTIAQPFGRVKHSPHCDRYHYWETTSFGSSLSFVVAIVSGFDAIWRNPWDHEVLFDTGTGGHTFSGLLPLRYLKISRVNCSII